MVVGAPRTGSGECRVRAGVWNVDAKEDLIRCPISTRLIRYSANLTPKRQGLLAADRRRVQAGVFNALTCYVAAGALQLGYDGTPTDDFSVDSRLGLAQARPETDSSAGRTVYPVKRTNGRSLANGSRQARARHNEYLFTSS